MADADRLRRWGRTSTDLLIHSFDIAVPLIDSFVDADLPIYSFDEASLLID